MNDCAKCEILIKEIKESEKSTGFLYGGDLYNTKCTHQPDRSVQKMPIVKFRAPQNMFDKAPYGERWIVMHDNEDSNAQIFIQASTNEDEPHWLRLDTFLEQCFKEFFSDEKFVQECLNLYKQPRCQRSPININNIIKS